MTELIAVGAMGLIGVILLVLLMHYFRLREIWQSLSKCRDAVRWARIFESENRELRRSLRAERRLNLALKTQLAKRQRIEPA